MFIDLTKRLKFLIGINISLAIILTLSLISYGDKSVTFDNQLFDIGDSSQIDRLQINKLNLVKITSKLWYVDENKYEASNTVVSRLMVVLKRLKIKRPVSKYLKDSILNDKFGKKLILSSFHEDKMINSFKLVHYKGEDIAIKDEKAYSVYIPGYDVNIYDYLDLKRNDVRNKQVLPTSWKTLSQFKITYPDSSKNLEIVFKKNFYEVKGVTRLDSLKLFQYIDQIGSFVLKDFIDNQQLLDSLKHTNFFCKLFIEDISYPIPIEVVVYQNSLGIYAISSNIKGIITFSKQEFNKILLDKDIFFKRPL